VGQTMTGSLPARMFTTFFVFGLACFGWVFFRAATFNDAMTVISNCALVSKAQIGLYMFGGPYADDLMLGISAIALLFFVDMVTKDTGVALRFDALPRALRWITYAFLALIILSFGAFGTNEFIYFQF